MQTPGNVKRLTHLVQPFLFVFIFLIASQSNGAPLNSTGKVFSGFSDGNWGVSALLGEPTGGRVTYFLDWKRALSVSGGYSYSKVFQYSADYLFYGYSARDHVAGENFWNALIFYTGAGLFGGSGQDGSDVNDGFQIGVRLIGGAEYAFTGTPWSLRLEGAPEFYFKGKNAAGFSALVGITFYIFDDPDKKPLKKLYQIKSNRDD